MEWQSFDPDPDPCSHSDYMPDPKDWKKLPRKSKEIWFIIGRSERWPASAWSADCPRASPSERSSGRRGAWAACWWRCSPGRCRTYRSAQSIPLCSHKDSSFSQTEDRNLRSGLVWHSGSRSAITIKSWIGIRIETNADPPFTTMFSFYTLIFSWFTAKMCLRSWDP